VQRAIAGQIISRFEHRGFRIAGIKMVKPTEGQLGLHYADDKDWKMSVGKHTRASWLAKGVSLSETDEQIGDRIRNWNMDCLRMPVVAMVLEGYHAVEVVRAMIGSTEPRASAPGTIRGDFTCDSYAKADVDKRVIRNLVHASGSVKDAEREIKLWFKDEELFDYPRHDWAIMHG
ncbi:MAG: nucleoside-diphosphate kinase, partial [Candidatus Woesearchaeota archaeon]|nr:nucleoside-diphosphate kinase [Candidatus Woesearchaeota archaeon]